MLFYNLKLDKHQCSVHPNLMDWKLTLRMTSSSCLFRNLAEIQEETDTIITPYEKNLGNFFFPLHGCGFIKLLFSPGGGDFWWFGGDGGMIFWEILLSENFSKPFGLKNYKSFRVLETVVEGNWAKWFSNSDCRRQKYSSFQISGILLYLFDLWWSCLIMFDLYWSCLIIFNLYPSCLKIFDLYLSCLIYIDRVWSTSIFVWSVLILFYKKNFLGSREVRERSIKLKEKFNSR